MVDDLRLAGMAKRAGYGYMRAIRKLSEFHLKSPVKINYISVLPEVITQNQVFQMSAECRTFRIKGIIWVTHTLGQRISEAVNLQVGDIDGER